MRYSLAELATLTSAELVGDPSYTVTGVNSLEEATPEDVSFLANPRYAEAMKQSKAGVICIDAAGPPCKNYLVSPHPSLTFQRIAEALLQITPNASGFTGIHPSAVIHETAQVGPDVSIGPNAVIDRDVIIGPRTRIGPNVSIGYGVAIGSDCHLQSNSVVRERCQLGHRVILQPGAIIGSCGFGYALDAQGNHVKLEQLGIVILEDDVEIGANTAIDRSRFKATLIRRGTKIDNLVQIGHNVQVGEHNIIASQTGISGSVKMGKYVVMGGQVGIAGHITIDDQVLIASRSGISKSLKTGQYRGSPAIPIKEYHRQEVYVRKLEEYVERLKKLEAGVTQRREDAKTQDGG